MTTLSLLQYHEYIDVEALRPLERRGEVDPDSGEAATLTQLRASGIYNDPNDLCLILTTGSVCCLALSVTAANLLTRIVWLIPIGAFGYATVLTQSRGGLLGLFAAVFVLLCLKFGPRRGAIRALIALPLALVAIGGRQADLNTEGEDTAQSRMRLWAEGLSLLWQNPITGIGAGEFDEEVGQVAHNSFLQAYVETGLLEGPFSSAPSYWPASSALSQSTARIPSTFRSFRHAPVCRCNDCRLRCRIVFLSRNMVVPTYMILAMGAAYINLALPIKPPRTA